MNKEGLVEIVSGAIALAASTVFVFAYNWVNLNNVGYSHPRAILPALTAAFSAIAPFGPVIPLAFAGFGFHFYRKKENGLACHILAHAGYLFSFAWVLLALWVWMLPYLFIGGLVKA
ncbi:MAG: hypothetical protein Q7R35_12105 [Elusimicrobiota bacterium]|nr:hypothetical protein [Elusimicrobiota bacterium]